mmetsp:Transcript_48595/g.114013  ORF Transcript_48595/g.114013 Transcript_48595/m.114013 type:complete len:85 (+) Transcript_48595:318-572(+)
MPCEFKACVTSCITCRGGLEVLHETSSQLLSFSGERWPNPHAAGGTPYDVGRGVARADIARIVGRRGGGDTSYSSKSSPDVALE